jgi:hypothetical protein
MEQTTLSKLHIKDGPHILIKYDGSEILLDKPVYNVSDEYLMGKNGFYKCSICKDWFDQIITLSENYHPKFVQNKQYCEACDETVNKSTKVDCHS